MRRHAVTRIRLTRKLAERFNGVDLSQVHVGDVLDLTPAAAEMMIDEGWAEPYVEPSLAKSAARKKPSPSRRSS